MPASAKLRALAADINKSHNKNKTAMDDKRNEKRNSNWWTPNRVFIISISSILVLSFIIVFLLTPAGERDRFWVEVILSIAGAAIVVLLVTIADRLFFLNEVSKRVETIVSNKFEERFMHSPWSSGITSTYSSLHATKFSEIIAENPDCEICLLDTYVPDPITIAEKINQALKIGCTFKFLVLDPESDQAKARAALLSKQGLDYEQFKHGTNIWMCIIASQAYNNSAFDKIKLRIYQEPPITPIYIIRKSNDSKNNRDKLFFSFYMDKASYSNVHLEVARIGQPLFETLEDYFDRMWTRNERNQINLEEYIKTSCPIGYLDQVITI